MKRIKILSIIIAMVYLLTACGTPGNEDIKEAVENETTETANEENNNQINDDQTKGEETVSEEKLNVIASFYPLYDFVNKIGGEKVNVTNLTQTGSAHGFEPSIEDMKKIVDSDLLVVNGAGFETWVEKVKENNPELNILEASSDIDLIEGNHDHDHDHEEAHDDHDHDHEEEHDNHDHDHEGHSHGEFDPHIWLSLDNAKEMIETIKDKLVELDSDNKDFYEDNYNKYKSELESLDEKYENAFKKYEGRSFVVPHEAFAYLVEDYNIKQIGIEGINSDTEPTLTRLGEIIDIMKDNNISTVFYEYGRSDKVANSIASEISGNVKEISTLEVLTELDFNDGKDYLTLMEMNLQNILDSFEGK